MRVDKAGEGKDDVDPGDLPDPRLGLLAPNHALANVSINTDPADGKPDTIIPGEVDKTDDQPSVRNIDASDDLAASAATFAVLRDARNSFAFEGPGFWVLHILNAYEGPDDKDNDPDNEDATYGANSFDSSFVWDVNNDESAVVYTETIRDAQQAGAIKVSVEKAEQRTVLHELGHQFGLGDEVTRVNPPKTVMSYHWFPLEDTAADGYTSKELARIRSVVQP